MYDHYYVLKELTKDREKEIMKMAAEANMVKGKPLDCYIPFLKNSNQYECN
jgi:hypothetical protein